MKSEIRRIRPAEATAALSTGCGDAFQLFMIDTMCRHVANTHYSHNSAESALQFCYPLLQTQRARTPTVCAKRCMAYENFGRVTLSPAASKSEDGNLGGRSQQVTRFHSTQGSTAL